MRTRRRTLLAVLIGTSPLICCGVAAQTPSLFSAEQRQEIERIAKEHLLRNPEILQEAAAALENRQLAMQRAAQRDTLRQAKDAIFNSPRDYVVGNPAGDVTLVEFFDYNCGYCKRSLADLQGLVRSDANLRIVLKDFPVLGPESVEASKVSLAVKRQLEGKKLFAYHAKLMETRGRVNGERAKAVAKDMGADVARLEKEMEDPEIRATLQENSVLAERLGLSGTPVFVVADELIMGAVGVEPLRAAIAKARRR